MGNAAKNPFDPKVFLARVGKGKTILQFHVNQKVFAQGEAADTVFYIQKGRVKLTVVSEHGKEAVVGILEPGHFFGEGYLIGRASHNHDLLRWNLLNAADFPDCSHQVHEVL